MKNLKVFIKNQLVIKYKTNYGLNSVKLKHRWFIKNGYEKEFKDIIKETEFLDNVSLSERLYCILNDITKKEKCLYCGNFVRYANYVEGYRRHCGDRKCSYEDKATYRDCSGLTADERSGKGLSANLKQIQKNGKSKATNKAKKIVEKKRNTIIEGKNVLTLTAEKAAKTKSKKIIEDGLNVSQWASKKAANTMATITINGKTVARLRTEKAHTTKSIVGTDGLDTYERAFLHGAGRNSSIKYYAEGLYYQGTYEKYFLDFMSSNGELQNISRGKRYNYFFQGQEKQYRSDFLYKLDLILEVKSSWTYGIKDEKKRFLNHLKFRSVLDSGDRLIVVLDKRFFIEVTYDTLSRNLYNGVLEPVDKLINFLRK